MNDRIITTGFPITVERDVVVCGGGTSGTVAAIAAARGGAKTLLLESSGSLGGTGTNGGVNGLHGMRRHWKGTKVDDVIAGMALEIKDRLVDMGAAAGRKGAMEDMRFDPEMYRLLMDQMCQEAGVELLFQTYVVDPVKEGDAVRGVTWINKSGKGGALAKVVIDATGDADVAAGAGAEVMRGRIDGWPMPITLCFHLGGITRDLEDLFIDGPTDNRMALLRKGQQQGLLPFAKNAQNFGFFQLRSGMERQGKTRPGMGRINMDMVYNCDATDARQLTDAWIYARKRMYEIVDYLRASVPGCEDAFVIYTSPMLGIRDSRNIVGDHVLTEDDFVSSRRFPDAIGRSGRAMNVHPPRGLPAEYKRQWEPPFWTETTAPFDIPYRALLPKGLENLLVVGRCISAKGLMQGSIRGEPQCLVTGQAGGTAAAIAVRDGVTPRRVDVAKLQAALRDAHAIL